MPHLQTMRRAVKTERLVLKYAMLRLMLSHAVVVNNMSVLSAVFPGFVGFPRLFLKRNLEE